MTKHPTPQRADNLNKLKKDHELLIGRINQIRPDAVGTFSAESDEILMIWPLYESLRQDLVKVDNDLFGGLRNFTVPEPREVDYSYHFKKAFHVSDLRPILNELQQIKGYIEVYEQALPISSKTVDTLYTLRLLAQRFNKVARQLRKRHTSRETLKIEDEYDVQDLLRALLQIFFDDVRPEEWTPSYAGKSARMDFLIKDEKAAIEVKKTRKGLEEKEIGDQLIIDIERYRNTRPECELLFCFVYDPEERIGNPIGLETDLSKKYGDLEVVVAVEPKK